MDVQIYQWQDLEVFGYIPRNVTSVGQMVLLFLIVFK